MSIKVLWDNTEKTIIRYMYEGRWTWDDFQIAYTEAKVMLDEVNHKVALIIDVRNSSLLPNGILSRAKNQTRTRHPNEDTVVIVGANAFVRAIYDVMRNLYADAIQKRGYYLASTVEEAHTLLANLKSPVSDAHGTA